MPQLLPFAGLRPDPAIVGPLHNVVCPPYDVISDQERAALMTRSPYNVVRVELPNGRYKEAAQLLGKWSASGALKREAEPALYGYRMTYPAPDGTEAHTLGVLGALVLEPPGEGILPHEQTTPKAKTDRLELIRATQANTSPIWCLSAQPGLADAVGPDRSTGTRAERAGAVAVRDDDGVLHEIWPIFDPAVHEQVAKLVGAGPVLVADGHHRYEVALAYQAEARARQSTTGPGCVLALVVELAEEHLHVQAIHRLVSGLPPNLDAVEALQMAFALQPTSAIGAELLAEMQRAGTLGAMTANSTWLARPRAENLRAGPGGVGRDLDSSRADAALLVLPPHSLRYEPSLSSITDALRTGQADLALLCRPATVDQIASTAHGGERMPPKTTYFWPKPRTGMVFRDFSA
jgi:uncharacterized protein (DUF1015 family)